MVPFSCTFFLSCFENHLTHGKSKGRPDGKCHFETPPLSFRLLRSKNKGRDYKLPLKVGEKKSFFPFASIKPIARPDRRMEEVRGGYFCRSDDPGHACPEEIPAPFHTRRFFFKGAASIIGILGKTAIFGVLSLSSSSSRVHLSSIRCLF